MPSGLYIHIPFCMRKCSYCDFISFDDQSDMHSAYVNALIKEINAREPCAVDTIFIGGGTPSCINAQDIYRILAACQNRFDLSDDAEISMEANPATLTQDKLHIYKESGINRISMGVQSMNDRELSALGRLHRSADVLGSYEMVRSAGFENVNLDVMFGIPDQTYSSFEYTINTLCNLNPEHLSVYSLILEENTILHSLYTQNRLTLPDEETERKMYDYAVDRLTALGYSQYEISNFSKRGRQCRHNLKYWRCEPYIGVGLAAHSYTGEERFYNTSDLNEYITLAECGQSAVTERIVLSTQDKISEYIIMGLRLCKGICLDTFQARFGVDMRDLYAKEIEKHLANGFLRLADGRLSFTRQGFSVSNSILCDFV